MLRPVKIGNIQVVNEERDFRCRDPVCCCAPDGCAFPLCGWGYYNEKGWDVVRSNIFNCFFPCLGVPILVAEAFRNYGLLFGFLYVILLLITLINFVIVAIE